MHECSAPVASHIVRNENYLFDDNGDADGGQAYLYGARDFVRRFPTYFSYCARHAQEGWTDLTTGRDYQSGKSTQNVANVQRTRNDMVRTVLASPSWTWAESVAA